MNSQEILLNLYSEGKFKLDWCKPKEVFQGPLEWFKPNSESASLFAFGTLKKPNGVQVDLWSKTNNNVALKISFKEWAVDGLEEEIKVYQQVSDLIIAKHYTPNALLCLDSKRCRFGDFMRDDRLAIGELYQNSFNAAKWQPQWFKIKTLPYTQLKKRWDFASQNKTTALPDLTKQKNALEPEYNRLLEKYQSILRIPVADLTANIVVTEKSNGKSLLDMFLSEQLSEDDFLKIIFQILFTLWIFNKVGIRHGDFHPGNIFIEKLPQTTDLAYVLNPKSVGSSTYFLLRTDYLVKIYDWDFGGIYEADAPFTTVINQQAILENFCKTQASCGRNEKADMTRLLMTLYVDHNVVTNQPTIDRWPALKGLIEKIYDTKIIQGFSNLSSLIGLCRPDNVQPGQCPKDIQDEELDNCKFSMEQPWLAEDCWIEPIEKILQFPDYFGKWKKTFIPGKTKNVGTPYVYGYWPDDQTRALYLNGTVPVLDIDKTEEASEISENYAASLINFYNGAKSGAINSAVRPTLNQIMFAMLAEQRGETPEQLQAFLDGVLPQIDSVLTLQELATKAVSIYKPVSTWSAKQFEIGTFVLFAYTLPKISVQESGLLFFGEMPALTESVRDFNSKSKVFPIFQGQTWNTVTNATNTFGTLLAAVPPAEIGFFAFSTLVPILSQKQVPKQNFASLMRIFQALPTGLWQNQPTIADLLTMQPGMAEDQLLSTAAKFEGQDAFPVWLFFALAQAMDNQAAAAAAVATQVKTIAPPLLAPKTSEDYLQYVQVYFNYPEGDPKYTFLPQLQSQFKAQVFDTKNPVLVNDKKSICFFFVSVNPRIDHISLPIVAKELNAIFGGNAVLVTLHYQGVNFNDTNTFDIESNVCGKRTALRASFTSLFDNTGISDLSVETITDSQTLINQMFYCVKQRYSC